MDMRQKVCEQCGYELVTRALQGTCPECGAYWDAMTGRGLQGDRAARRQRRDRLINRLRTIALGVAALLMLSCGGFFSWLAYASGRNPWRPIAVVGVLAAVLVLAAVTSYVYEDES